MTNGSGRIARTAGVGDGVPLIRPRTDAGAKTGCDKDLRRDGAGQMALARA